MMTNECQNCDWRGEDVRPVVRLLERVGPGEPMPSGECPECGALCHLILYTFSENELDLIKDALQDAMEHLDDKPEMHDDYEPEDIAGIEAQRRRYDELYWRIVKL